MFDKFFKFIKKIFIIDQQAELEKFVAAKNPTNTAEVEYWIAQYTHRQTGCKL